MGQAFKPVALVVEDDPNQRDLLSVLLEEAEFHVFACESAEAALGVLDRYGSAMSMLVTDVQLAGRMTGADLAYVAKHRHPNLSIIVTSGNAEPALPSNTLFMPKPWHALDILREAERVH
jgi:DNA-binding NtrC family response regulator